MNLQRIVVMVALEQEPLVNFVQAMRPCGTSPRG